MFDISVEIKYCIDHDQRPKTVLCRVTVGLPMGNPSKDYSLNSLLYDNNTEFMGETLAEKWGRYDSSKSHFRRFVTQEYTCEYTVNGDGSIAIAPISFADLTREFIALEQVIQYNLDLKKALPPKQEYVLSISEQGKINLSALS